MTNDQHKSLGLIRIAVEDLLHGSNKKYVAVVQSVMGIPVEILDDVFLGLEQSLDSDGVGLGFKKYPILNAFIDIHAGEV